MKVRFLQRNLITEQPLPHGLIANVEDYSKVDVGGCDTAYLTVSGDSKHLTELLEYLRFGVEIYDDSGSPLWWGFVNHVEVPVGNIVVVADLESMYNSVAIAYNLPTTTGSGVRSTTEYQVDPDSVRKYGIKQLLEGGGDLTGIVAANKAKIKLNEVKEPSFYPDATRNLKEARIECLGWWHTLDWQYSRVPTGLALAFEAEEGEWGMGNGDVFAQSFETTAEINLAEASIRVRKVGEPGALKISVHEFDGELEPGDNLGSVSIAQELISENMGWVRELLNSEIPLVAGGRYFLQISADDVDGGNHYVLGIDENRRYGAGKFIKRGSGNSWFGTDADLPFRLYANVPVETTIQIQSHLTQFGQFFGRIWINEESGLIEESYRAGDTTALAEVNKLLESGVLNGRRLLSKVNIDRTVDVWQAPENSEVYTEIKPDGKLYYLTGSQVEPNFNPVGKWVGLESILYGAKPMYIEAAEWGEDGLKPFPAGWKNPYNQRIENG